MSSPDGLKQSGNQNPGVGAIADRLKTLKKLTKELVEERAEVKRLRSENDGLKRELKEVNSAHSQAQADLVLKLQKQREVNWELRYELRDAQEEANVWEMRLRNSTFLVGVAGSNDDDVEGSGAVRPMYMPGSRIKRRLTN
ncbi:hypothetical protein DL767_004068 [Monosporascus sp. MG133]|nr:hypothetical protein DL767_004068 [Monosporascus sp. MG133]